MLPLFPSPLKGAPSSHWSIAKSHQGLLRLRILRDYSKSSPSRGTVPSAIPKSSLLQLPLTQLLFRCPSRSSSCSLCSADTQASPLPFSLCLDVCPENPQGQVRPDCPVTNSQPDPPRSALFCSGLPLGPNLLLLEAFIYSLPTALEVTRGHGLRPKHPAHRKSPNKH